jgi:ribonuclease T1
LNAALLAVALLAGAMWPAYARNAQITAPAPVAATDLPQEARAVLAIIKQGGPFPYARDGSVFGNYERQLPPKPRGYYREYTVRTPGTRDRGARRIVCGGPRIHPDDCWYTGDHYQSFHRIVRLP